MGSIATLHLIAASASLSPLLQDASWEGEIGAVFHSSLLCIVPHDRLLHLHSGPQLVSPFSLRAAGDCARALHEIPLSKGMQVRKVGSTIDVAGRLHLRLDHVTYYQSPRHRTAKVDSDAVAIARQTLTASGRSGGFDQLTRAQTVVTAMQQALAAGDSAQMLEVARHLIGLGPGLTPSGDDFLVGYLRGLWLLHHTQRATSLMRQCLRAGLLPDLDDRTTRVGAEFIRYALAGDFAEVLDRAALALFGATYPQAVQFAVSCLLAQGETSGSDTTRGLLTSLEALMWISEHEPCQQWQDAPAVYSKSGATRK
jgi:Protein of unknown function (DUF2877)